MKNLMKKLMFVIAVAILAVPRAGLVYAQDESIDVNLQNILGGGNQQGRGGNRAPVLPDSKEMFAEIENTLKKGKTPLEKDQIKPLKSLLDLEIVTLADKIQLLRNNNGNNPGNAPGFPEGGNPPQGGPGGRGGGRGGRGGGEREQQANPQTQQQTQQQQQSAQALTVDTLTTLSNDELIETKLPLFLSPEQVALVKKAKADDKNNSTCLGGLLDRVFNQLQNRNNQNFNNQNQNQNQNQNRGNQANNNNNSANRPNGQKYCMAADATAAQRLEPIRKVLANGKLPLAADKEPLAEVVMTAQIGTLEQKLRTTLTQNQGGGRGGNNNNNNNNNNKIQQTIQTTKDAMYKKIEASLKPEQAATLKTWHYTQMLGRSPVETLIAVNAMQDTPLSEEQITKVSVAWTEIHTQIYNAAKAANKNVSTKDVDKATMNKVLEMLEPTQVASYQLAIKYGPEAAAGGGK